MTEPLRDLRGRQVGDWIVEDYVGGPRYQWTCRCVCGTRRPVDGGNLRRALRTGAGSGGCGCRKKAKIAAGNTIHGHSAGGATSETYHSWRNMLARCYNPKATQYKAYGAVGVRVYESWRKSFETFLTEVGRRPSKKHTLDRFPNKSGNYEPGNVRWALPTEQANNKRNNLLITAHGRTQSASQWAAETGIERNTIKQRLRSGWSPEEAVTLRPGASRRCAEAGPADS